MASVSTIPLSITPEASAQVAKLGMEEPFEQMLEHTRETVPGLRSIRVTLQPPYDLGEDPCVLIEANRDNPQLQDDPTDREWGYWRLTTFSPKVFPHFVMYSVYRPDNAG